MKKQLLALSMVAASGLFAQADSPMQGQMQNQNNCCRECACNPCCCTNPRPCVDCECYVPAFGNLQCDWGFSFDAEFLYWYARETNLSYAVKVPMVNTNLVDPNSSVGLTSGVGEEKYLHSEWDPGFRVGIGFNSSCDGWDSNLTWTWYHNKQCETTSVPDFLFSGAFNPFELGAEGEYILINPWNNKSLLFQTFDKVKAKYRLRFNQIDLDLGKKFWLSECFNLRIYSGLRGAWTRVRFATVSERNSTTEASGIPLSVSRSYSDSFKTRMWGVGLIAGVEPVWYFSRCFALYGQAGTGAIWGDFEIRKKEDYTNFQLDSLGREISYDYKDSGKNCQSQMTGLLDLSLGLRWERTWCCDRYRSALDLGWEHHIYFDQNHRAKNYGRFSANGGTSNIPVLESSYTGYFDNPGNLGFGGLVLRVNFDF